MINISMTDLAALMCISPDLCSDFVKPLLIPWIGNYWYCSVMSASKLLFHTYDFHPCRCVKSILPMHFSTCISDPCIFPPCKFVLGFFPYFPYPGTCVNTFSVLAFSVAASQTHRNDVSCSACDCGDDVTCVVVHAAVTLLETMYADTLLPVAFSVNITSLTLCFDSLMMHFWTSVLTPLLSTISLLWFRCSSLSLLYT